MGKQAEPHPAPTLPGTAEGLLCPLGPCLGQCFAWKLVGTESQPGLCGKKQSLRPSPAVGKAHHPPVRLATYGGFYSLHTILWAQETGLAGTSFSPTTATMLKKSSGFQGVKSLKQSHLSLRTLLLASLINPNSQQALLAQVGGLVWGTTGLWFLTLLWPRQVSPL